VSPAVLTYVVFLLASAIVATLAIWSEFELRVYQNLAFLWCNADGDLENPFQKFSSQQRIVRHTSRLTLTGVDINPVNPLLPSKLPGTSNCFHYDVLNLIQRYRRPAFLLAVTTTRWYAVIYRLGEMNRWKMLVVFNATT
jgi:hypothetical protein